MPNPRTVRTDKNPVGWPRFLLPGKHIFVTGAAARLDAHPQTASLEAVLGEHLLNLFSGVLELKDLLQRLPARLNRFIDALANNEFKVSVDAIDERKLMIGFQKVANRITIGLVVAALIVGAALLMRVETTFRIWGYPGLAIIFFLGAAGCGVVLLINIVFYDKSNRD